MPVDQGGVTDFYLGAKPPWLDDDRVTVPLFVSHRALALCRRLPRARVPWALDSGGYTELSVNGRWVTPVGEYVDAVERYAAEVGMMAWAAPMDWLCGPDHVRHTGLSVVAHQRLTVANVVTLRTVAPHLPWVPVLQGWTVRDYVEHVAMYRAVGIDLTAESTVGIGSIAARQATAAVVEIVATVADMGIRLHGFGVKTAGIGAYGALLRSADSMSWSYAARMRPVRMEGCTHKKCSHCPRWAQEWRRLALVRVGAPGDVQRTLLG